MNYKVYNILTINELLKVDKNFNGILCKNGLLFTCGTRGHYNLNVWLYDNGYSDNDDWTDSKEIIHISHGLLNGSILSDIWRLDDGDESFISDAQFDMLKHMSDFEFYSNSNFTVGEVLLKHHIAKCRKGAKYGGISFIKKIWANIATPNIDLPVDQLGFVRSSPLKSMAGVLFSKVGHFEEVTNQLTDLWCTLPESLTKWNSLYTFNQELVDGVNGVFHYTTNKKFSYACSDAQGDIVKGKKGNLKLSKNNRMICKKIGETFAEFFCKSVQCEFVIDRDKLENEKLDLSAVKIVQLRLLENEPKVVTNQIIPNDVIFTGQSFCSYVPFGKWSNMDTVKKSEIHIVDADCEDTLELFGKKLLIVKNDTEFSHVLAFSKATKIPSMFNISNKKINWEQFSDDDLFEFDTTNQIGWIRKIS